MKKKTAVILLILTALTGSVITFYASNMLFSDLSNMFYGVHDDYIISSVPLFMISLDFSAAFIFVMRFFRYPQYKKKTVRLYTVYLIINSAIGTVFSVLSGTHIYHSFLTPYPFFCYPLLMLLLNTALLITGAAAHIRAGKQPDDPERRHFKLKYILYSIMLSLLTYFAFNKLGALLFAPFYVQTRTLYMTFPFYVSMLLPALLLAHIVTYFMDGYAGREKTAVRAVLVLFLLNLVFGISVFVIGCFNTGFISAVSPALALERLAAFPINTVFQFAVMFIMTLYYLIYAVITLKKTKLNE